MWSVLSSISDETSFSITFCYKNFMYSKNTSRWFWAKRSGESDSVSMEENWVREQRKWEVAMVKSELFSSPASTVESSRFG